MADDQDEYLSDKFLVDAALPSKTQTYADKRKEALRRAQIKNEQNRTKSRRQREVESRQEGLSKSLFDRAAEEPTNKALSMMIKMGYKPGESLGKTREEEAVSEPSPDRQTPPAQLSLSPTDSQEQLRARFEQHRAEPLPLNEWQGT